MQCPRAFHFHPWNTRRDLGADTQALDAEPAYYCAGGFSACNDQPSYSTLDQHGGKIGQRALY
jgi:hypothetical protein